MPTPTPPADITTPRKTQLYRFLIPASGSTARNDLPAIVAHLSRASVWFEVTPLPDGETEILLKAEDPNKTLLPLNTFVDQVERRTNPFRKSRLATGRLTPDRAGAPWTPAEETSLLEQFDSETAIKTIAKNFQRTRRSITVRLARNGRVAPLKPSNPSAPQPANQTARNDPR